MGKLPSEDSGKAFHTYDNVPTFQETHDLLGQRLKDQRKLAQDSAKKPIYNYKLYIVLGVAIIFILVSLVIELSSDHSVGHGKNESSIPYFFKSGLFYSGLFRELGFACFISAVIIYFVEARHREEANLSERAALITLIDNAENASQRLNAQVFDSVLRRKIPENILDHLLNTTFSARFSRRDLNLKYDIDPITEINFNDEDKKKELNEYATDNLIKMTITLSYKMKNVTDMDLQCPIALSLPITNLQDLKKYCRIESLIIGGNPVDDEEIKQAWANSKDKVASHRTYRFKRNLERGAEVSVRFVFVLIKEMSDNELWTSLFPSEDMEVTVDMNVQNLEWSIDALSHGSMKEITGNTGLVFQQGSHVFQSDVPVLPFQGLNFWWRRETPLAHDKSGTVFKIDATRGNAAKNVKKGPKAAM